MNPTRKYLFLLSFLILLPIFACSASAETTSDETIGETIPDEYSDFLDVLPEDLKALLPDELFSSDTETVATAIRKISNFSYLLQTVLSMVGVKSENCLRLLASVLGILLLSAVCRTIQTSFNQTKAAQAFSFCTTLIILSFLLTRGYETIQTVTDYFSSVNTITAASLPLMGALYAIGGNVSTAVASSSGLTVFMTLLEEGIGKTIVPFCGICLAFATIGNLNPSLHTDTLLGTFKKHYTTLLTFLMMLLLAMLSAQTTLAAKSDTLTMRSVKFAAGNLIPVVGGSVSELLRTVSAGIGYLRGTVGICALLLLLLLLLPMLIELFLIRFCWQLAAAVADLLGCEHERRLLEEFSSVHGYLIAAVCVCSSVLFLGFTLLAHCASAIG